MIDMRSVVQKNNVCADSAGEYWACHLTGFKKISIQDSIYFIKEPK